MLDLTIDKTRSTLTLVLESLIQQVAPISKVKPKGDQEVILSKTHHLRTSSEYLRHWENKKHPNMEECKKVARILH
jgi:hypothetical protein